MLANLQSRHILLSKGDLPRHSISKNLSSPGCSHGLTRRPPPPLALPSIDRLSGW
jgi:hypothetical protein